MADALTYIDISLHDSQARICTRGAVVTQWLVPSRTGEFNLIDGYASDSEVLAGDGCRSALLAPWSNRIAGASYTWQGKSTELAGAGEPMLEALHGLVLAADFTVDIHEEDYVSLSTVVRDEHYPVPFALRADYTLSEAEGVYELNLTLTAENLGEIPAPIGLGWHPYIRYEGARSDAELIVEAKTRIEVDEALIPLAGAAAFTELAGLEATDTQAYIEELSQLWIGDLSNLDTAFTDLVIEETNGTVGASLFHASGARTDVVATSLQPIQTGVGVLHFFTGEPLAQRATESLAMEFCQFMTNAFNRPECEDYLQVLPGQTQEMSVSILHAADPETSHADETELQTTSLPIAVSVVGAETEGLNA
ncbi:hypothetical protein NXS08_05400 [Gleimia sp. 6138-11-ORH1]|uniref:aldose 1-epimerase n=1 Tax=Gleimia sp. 6138-11-ORH1 TaxID=2973937 RepID=UPI002167F4C0|nr:hypothetical protein [Gleimia sp. 6138-11-ORH1]MCS4484908.1 hypothetical protein [Gleimia sp. 6138-11-ORH1]